MMNTTDMEERSIFSRIFFCFLWFLPFCFVTNSIIGGVVGGLAGTQAHADNYEAAAAVVGPAVQEFFHKNGPFIFGNQILAYAALCLLRWVPGVSKYKRVKEK
ncbi:MAG TPA: hypothetical protein VMH87_18160 [Pseudomonadales bacterium]|nr:hypothetical protein [Pseudomonadales bacterium]